MKHPVLRRPRSHTLSPVNDRLGRLTRLPDRRPIGQHAEEYGRDTVRTGAGDLVVQENMALEEESAAAATNLSLQADQLVKAVPVLTYRCATDSWKLRINRQWRSRLAYLLDMFACDTSWSENQSRRSSDWSISEGGC